MHPQLDGLASIIAARISPVASFHAMVSTRKRTRQHPRTAPATRCSARRRVLKASCRPLLELRDDRAVLLRLPRLLGAIPLLVAETYGRGRPLMKPSRPSFFPAVLALLRAAPRGRFAAKNWSARVLRCAAALRVHGSSRAHERSAIAGGIGPRESKETEQCLRSDTSPS